MKRACNPYFSIIIPVYNAIEYVEYTIQCVLNQTYENFELLLIDDGATDGSGEICDKYAKVDQRIIVIHKANGGICSARNEGISQAKGEYIVFCDHDDYYEEHYLETMFSHLKKNANALVKVTYSSQYYVDDVLDKELLQTLPTKDIRVNELPQQYDLLNATVRVIWNGAYKRSTIVDNNISFDEHIKAGMEDFVFNYNYLNYIDLVSFESTCLLHHFARTGQSTSEKYDPGRLNDITTGLTAEYDFLSRNMVSDRWIQHQWTYLALFIKTLLHSDNQSTMREKVKRLRVFRRNPSFSQKTDFFTWIRDFKSMPISVIKVELFRLKMYYLLIFLIEGIRAIRK